ncbi:capping complex subunit for YIEGIA [Radiobacillus sp. PE A8.2]|uniref:capping complex subunit for YIEGIA n=1 Tax=Radiobacillus sp. PE A8.2 TaxID=3380349 RepID=UPI00388DEEFA
MNIEKAVLSVITTNEKKIAGGAPIFLCDTKEEMNNVAANLEAILDGISHALSDDMYIIVKH